MSKEKIQEMIKEGTPAADTLNPGAGSSGGQTKPQMLATFVKMMADLGMEDLSKFYNDSIAKIGKEADSIPDGAANHNKMTIMTKEDMDAIFEDTLSEEVKEKTATIFEAAVNTKAILIEAELQEKYNEKAKQLEEEYENKLQEEVESVLDGISEQMEIFTDSVVEFWLDENRIAIESQLKADISEEFIEGMKNLFKEHYIDVPEDKLDILGELHDENIELKENLNKLATENLEFTKKIQENEKAKIIDKLSEGLAVSESEKLKNLLESIDYSDLDKFETKAKVIKENYFDRAKKQSNSGLINEEIDPIVEDKSKPATNHNPLIAAALNEIKNQSKK